MTHQPPCPCCGEPGPPHQGEDGIFSCLPPDTEAWLETLVEEGR